MASAAICSILLIGTGAIAQDAQDITVIRAGSLFDSRTGDVARDQLIFVEGERIIGVTPADEGIPDGANVIDLSESFVLPGVMDMHTHIVSNLANNFFAGYFQSPAPGHDRRCRECEEDADGRL